MKLSPFNHRAFTLVELLVVVSIIGVLAIVGVPTFRLMVQKAKQAEAALNSGNMFISRRCPL